jgi:glycosyltransferase involved in cell wall biosynthesis
MTDEVVSVVIPAFNAASTLDETIRSARAQSYAPIEILVVDDSSTDITHKIASRHAREDSRIRVLRQAHRGPSAARNLGIAQAKGSLIAPLDADDLWRPTKIERQVAAMRAGGPRVGLVYTWFALIDGGGRILSTGHRPVHSGEVLRACCRRNLVGNGSGALMRKSAVIECGGYDESLEGCEDLKLYAAIAARYHFAVVPEHLTGYRRTNQNLTSHVAMLRRSADVVLAELEQRYPQFYAELHDMKCDLYHWLVRRGFAARRLTDTLQIAHALWRLDRRFAFRSLVAVPTDLLACSRLARTLTSAPSGRRSGRFSMPPDFLADQTQP